MMRLYATVLILNLQLAHIFAYPPNSIDLSSQANNDVKGYECGNFFFTDKEVKKTLSVARASVDEDFPFPQRYQGKLYVESEFEEYFLYPIQNGRLIPPYYKEIRTLFRVVFTRNSDEAVDVISKITNGDYAKCIHRGSTNIGTSHAVLETPNGYLCGYEFFTDETIDYSLALAQREFEGKPKYLRPYDGRLYPKNVGYLMWPIMIEDYSYILRGGRIGQYQLILNNERKIVDVVVKGFQKNYLRCIRSRKSPQAPASDQYSKLFVPPSNYGYICGKNIFNGDVLEQTAKMLQNEATEALKANLREFSGPPFHQPCLIWPIFLGGKSSKAGPKGSYRLVLTQQYKVMTVAMYANGIYKACEKISISAKKNHDRSSYHCMTQIFNEHHLIRAAEQACVRLNSVRKKKYPAVYDGPEFEKEGPYLTYPVFENGLFKSYLGLHRVVINTNCEVVGALTTLDDGKSKRLVKCHRLDDGPLQYEFFGANAQTVFESLSI